jgi:hypothetical protein
LVCIDESGNFDLPADRVCVGGLLLKEADSPMLRLALKTQLDVIFPHLDYPPHATCYNRPSQHLVAWKRLSMERRKAVPLGLAMLLDTAEQQVLNTPGAPAELSGPGGAPLLTPPLLARLDDWLRLHATGALDPLNTVRSSSQAKLEQLLAHLTQLCPGHCAVVAAAEVPSVSAPASAPDRYLRLLAVLFERLIALLHSGPPGPRLVVRIASRGVWRPTGARTPLAHADVLAAYQEAVRASPTGVDIELQVEPPEDYDAQVHPGLVLADFAMNRLRSRLGARTWSILAGQLKASLQLPAELFVAHVGRHLPTIAAHTALPLNPRPPGGEAGWMEQQAAQWASALQALRREEVTS